MSYLVLARKFRPMTFSEVTGQEHVTKTLANAITRDRVAHAYLFAGPRGVGKTSIARIFSKALNCKNGPTVAPCAKCPNCLDIAAGTSLAVREIDGASHNSVDNVRELIETFRALPPPGSRYKIYIVDEVHMLSTSAFNALLKSLEEPPPNTVFILATTEAHKIPETVISRCQRHDFRALSQDEIQHRLGEMVASEGISIQQQALRALSRLAEGSMRDAQSLLERVHAFCDGEVTEAAVSQVLGGVERTTLEKLIAAILKNKPQDALAVIGEVFAHGVDPSLFLKEFAGCFRELLIAKFGGAAGLGRLGLAKDEQANVLELVREVTPQDLQDVVEVARDGADRALRSAYPIYAIEALVTRLAARIPVAEIADIVGRLESGGGSPPGPKASNLPPSPPATAKGAGVASSPAAAGVRDWSTFVRRVSEAGSKMLAENLKQLAVEEFSPGKLVAKAPEFLVSLLSDGEQRRKLDSFLATLCGASRWQISLKAAAETDGSIAAQENVEKQKSRQAKQESVSNHPALKTLQKVFPGSEIEAIKVKE